MILKTLFPMLPRASTLAAPDSWLRDILVGTKAASGEHVSPRSALGFSAYFACIRNISEDVAKLPLMVYERQQPRGKLKMTDHPVYRLLHDAPSEEMTAMSFRETITSHALGWHGGFAEIVRRGDGRPAALYPLDPNTIAMERSDTGRIRYRVNSTNSASFRNDVSVGTPLRSEQVLHIRGLGFDGLTQYCMSIIGRESLGAALGAQRFSGAFFGNNATASGVIEVPGAMKDEQLRHMREAFAERHQGSANAYKPFILENAAKWTQVSTDPEKSQLNDARLFNVEDVARWFRVPPHKVGSLARASFSNIESQAIEYVVDTLMSWLTRWEQEIRRKLFLPSESGFFAEHIVNGLLRGDAAARSAYYNTRFMIGTLSQNDIRELENENPIEEGGDTYYVPLNMVPSTIAELGPQNATSGTTMAPDATQGVVAEEPASPPQNASKRLLAVGNANRPLLEAAVNANLGFEASFVMRHANKRDFDNVVVKFYSEQADHLFAKAFPVIDAFCESAWSVLSQTPLNTLQKQGIHHRTKALCVRHVEQSKRELREPEVVAAWATGPRAAVFARDEIKSLSGWLLSLI